MSEESKAIADAMSAAKLDTLIGDVGELKHSMKELTRAVNRLALIEERQANTTDSLGRSFKEIERHDARINVLEHSQPIHKQTTDIVQKAVALIVTLVVGTLIGMVVMAPKPAVPAVTQSR